MTKHAKRAVRAVCIAALLAIGAGPAELAFAGGPCDSIPDPMQRAQCNCSQGQSDYSSQTAAIISQQAKSDPYLQAAHDVVPGAMASLGVPGVTQSCNATVKSAFDSLLSSAGSMFGFDLNSVFGGMTGSAEGQVCQSINNAIMSKTSVACPTVSIPGYPISCGGSVSMSGTGSTFSGPGSAGGYSGSSIGGLGSTGSSGGGSTGGSVSTGGGESTGGLGSTIGCWFTGSCP